MSFKTSFKPAYLSATGHVTAIRGGCVLASIPQAALGDQCSISTRNKGDISARIIAFHENSFVLAPFSPLEGISPGDKVKSSGTAPFVSISTHCTGSVLDALGNCFPEPADRQKAKKHTGEEYGTTVLPLSNPVPNPLGRKPIDTILETGIRAIDLFCPVGYGQRIGLFAGAGTGKSTLLGMIIKNAKVDVCVTALVGERGREVGSFISDNLGVTGLSRSVVIVSTSDECAIRRAAAPQTATAIAEFYRDQGLNVLLTVDSLTRTARAIREVGLAAGEIPVRRGYTPSVYAELPMLLERSGNNEKGSITAVYSVLTDRAAGSDPLEEEIKSILDGHIVLSGDVSAKGIWPAIDLTQSVSRLTGELLDTDLRKKREEILKLIKRLKNDRDLIALGASPDSELKTALELEPEIKALLTQGEDEKTPLAESRATLNKIYVSLLKAKDQ